VAVSTLARSRQDAERSYATLPTSPAVAPLNMRVATAVDRAYLKYLLKRGAAPFGLRFRAGARPHRDLAETLRHLARVGVDPGTVIDVGVADGTFELYETFPRARHLLVEPQVEFEPALRAISARYHAEYVLAVADAADGTVLIDTPEDLHGSTVIESVDPTRGRQVPAITLDSLVQERVLSPPFLVKVDVQGAELRVLEGAQRVLGQSAAVVLETSLMRFHTLDPELHEIIAYMRERGFAVYDVCGGVRRPLDGALAQLDVTFVPTEGRLRADTRFMTGAQLDAERRRLVSRLRRRLRI
jgi:FkbM family methyltransferase